MMQKDEKQKPPSMANWLITKFIRHELQEEFCGDLQEIYKDRIATKGNSYAKWMYWIDVFHLLIGFTSFKLFSNKNNPTIMFRHYVLVSGRNLLRNKVYSLINLSGLSVGMGICLVICQYIYFELSYDSFHNNAENIYRVITEERNSELNETYPKTGYSLGVEALEEIPEIKQYVRKERCNRGAIVSNPLNNSVFHEEINDLLFVDHSFFNVFKFPLISGKKEALFNDKYSIVLTERTARKYFGDEDPLGKVLKINGPPSPGDYTVTGILKDLPLNSHLQFDFLMPIENFLEYGWGGAVKKQGGWKGFSVVTYLTLDAAADKEIVCNKLNELIARHRGEGQSGQGIVKEVILQPVTDIYMESNNYSDAGYINSTGNIQNIRIFSIVSFFILFIAWVNYINLSTAISIKRAKEVGIRKALGAFKKQLVSQFILESILVNSIAAALSLGVAFFALPFLSEILGKNIPLNMLELPMFWGYFLAFVLIGSLLSGLYPAFVLSTFKPVGILKGQKNVQGKKIDLRKGLIVFQFFISLLLISSTYLVYRQTTFMKSQELSIDMEKILVLKTQQVGIDKDIAEANFRIFKNGLAQHHSIAAVTSANVTPGQYWESSYRESSQLEQATPYSRSIITSWGFSETYGLDFLAGGPFTEKMKIEEVAIINESALKVFGFESPEKALKSKLIIGKNRNMEIVGVVKDFHWHSLKEPHTPYVIDLGSFMLHPFISVRMNLSDIPESLAHIESIFNKSFPDQPFEYFFADETFNRQYHSEVQFGSLFLSFSVLAVFVACVGLFALVAHSTTSKTKEIGIRKVLGARTGNLMLLLSKEYLFLILIAIVIAIPIVFFLGQTWLENYASKIEIGFDLFVIPALALLFISLFTVGHRTFSTARSNPVDSLRH